MNGNERYKATIEALNAMDGVYAHDLRTLINGTVSITKGTKDTPALIKAPLVLAADDVMTGRDLRGFTNGTALKLFPLVVFIDISDRAA